MLIIDEEEIDQAINLLDLIYTELRGINQSFAKIVDMIEEELTAAAKAFEYPFAFIAGIRIDPSAATSATADPLISAKKSEAVIEDFKDKEVGER